MKKMRWRAFAGSIEPSHVFFEGVEYRVVDCSISVNESKKGFPLVGIDLDYDLEEIK